MLSAVALATILAIVAGLVIAGSAALSHDLWVGVVRRGRASPHEELLAGRVSSVALVVAALLLSRVFLSVNVGLLSALGYAVAASAVFPVLLLKLFWRPLNPPGAIAGVCGGLVSSLVLIWLSPLVQVSVLRHAYAPFPLQSPAAVSVLLALLAAVSATGLSRLRRHGPPPPPLPTGAPC